MYCPTHRAIAAVVLVVIILRVTGGGKRLGPGGTHLPAASINGAAGLGGGDGDFGAVHLLTGFQTDFVGVHGESEIKTPVGGLCWSRPIGRIVFCIGNVRDFRATAFRGNLFAYDGDDLPGVPGGRIVDISIVAVFP